MRSDIATGYPATRGARSAGHDLRSSSSLFKADVQFLVPYRDRACRPCGAVV